MKDILSLLESLHRPRLLMQAARIGLQEYDRQRFLSRLLRSALPPGPGAAIASLMQIEARLEARQARLLRARLDTSRPGRHRA